MRDARTDIDEETQMSFQAYLDALEDKTGKTPAQLLEIACTRGFDSAQ